MKACVLYITAAAVTLLAPGPSVATAQPAVDEPLVMVLKDIGRGKPLMRPVASVNGYAILAADVAAAWAPLAAYKAGRGEKLNDWSIRYQQHRILEQLIEDELLRQEYARAHILRSPNRRAEAMQRVFAQQGVSDVTAYAERLNLDVRSAEVELARHVLFQEYLEVKQGSSVSEAAMRSFYDENSARYAIKERVKASHILIGLKEKKSGKVRTEAEGLAAAKKVHAEVTTSNFGEVARRLSEGPSAPRGGDLGWFTRGRMVKPFEEVAFSTAPEKISAPFKTRFGWHIVLVHSYEEDRVQTFDEVRASIREHLLKRSSKGLKSRHELIRRLRTSAIITRDLNTLDAAMKQHIKTSTTNN